METKRRRLGCLGWGLLLVVGGLALSLGGQLAFVVLEVLALAFTPLGVADPALGWGLAGLVLGGLTGMVLGLRRAGRSKQGLEFVVVLLVLGGLAYAAVNAAEGYFHFDPFDFLDSTASEPPDSERLFSVVVEAEGLNVRPAPNTDNDPFATVARGQHLDVFESHGDWYRVRIEEGGEARYGWVSADHVRRLDEGTDDEPPAADSLDPDTEAADASPEPPDEPGRAATPGREPPGGIYGERDTDTPPRLTSRIPPVASPAGGFEGLAHLRVVVDPGGALSGIRCVAPASGLVCARAAQAVYQATFEAGRVNGRPVPAWLDVRVVVIAEAGR